MSTQVLTDTNTRGPIPASRKREPPGRMPTIRDVNNTAVLMEKDGNTGRNFEAWISYASVAASRPFDAIHTSHMQLGDDDYTPCMRFSQVNDAVKRGQRPRMVNYTTRGGTRRVKDGLDDIHSMGERFSTTKDGCDARCTGGGRHIDAAWNKGQLVQCSHADGSTVRDGTPACR